MEHAMDGPAWLLFLQKGVVGKAMRQSLFLYPAVEVLHILGFATLIGSVIALDLRLMGFARHIPVRTLARHLLPVSITGFCIAAPMGLLLFVTEAVSVAQNPAFLAKLSLIVLAGINAAVFRLGPWRAVGGWNTDAAPPFAARMSAVLSMAFWLGAAICGRLIAYL